MSCPTSKSSLQSPKKPKSLKVLNCGKNGTTSPVAVSRIAGKTKLVSSRSTKRCPVLRKCSQVEAVYTGKVDHKMSLQTVKVENETSRVDIVRRLQSVGIPFKGCQTALCGYAIATPQNQQIFNQPMFQSSIFLTNNLETLKMFEIETRNLVNLNIQNDIKMQKLLNSKVSTVLDQSQSVFSRLQPISLNVEQLITQDESKLQSLAEKYAPQIRYRDPQICLKDFVDCVVISETPVIPESSFHELCYEFHIDLCTEKQIFNENPLIPYVFWFS